MMVFPELFAENNRLTVNITKSQMEKYKHTIKWKKNASILEAGYADGGTSQKSFLPYLPSDIKEFIATDISESMVEYARNNSRIPSTKFAQLDIAAKKVPSEFLNRFDHIFGFFLMHMVKNPRQAFENMYKMLKPDGSIFLTFFERIPLDDTIHTLSKHPVWSEYGPEKFLSPFYYSSSPRQEWETIMNETGFKNHEIFEDHCIHEFIDEKEFDQINLSVCAFLPNIPEEKQKEFEKEYAEINRTAKMLRTEIRDGKKVLSWHCKMFVTSASKNYHDKFE